MKRWVVRVVVCLVLGVMTTVGVAWGLAAVPSIRPVKYAGGSLSGSNMYTMVIVGSLGRSRRCAAQGVKGVERTGLDLRLVAKSKVPYVLEEWGNLSALRYVDTPLSLPQGEEQATGWPFLCLWCEFDLVRSEVGYETATLGGIALPSSRWTFGVPHGEGLPLRPIWFGFFVNSVVYSLIWAAIAFAVTGGPRSIQRRERRRVGRCPTCGYDLVHKFDAGCPECGWNRA